MGGWQNVDVQLPGRLPGRAAARPLPRVRAPAAAAATAVAPAGMPTCRPPLYRAPMPRTAACSLCGNALAAGRGGRGVGERAVYCDPCRARIAGDAASRRAACAECGTAFRAPSRSVRRCSDTCREKGCGRRGQRTPSRPLPPHDGTAACRICGKTFRAPTRIVKYCPDGCRKKGHMRARRSAERRSRPRGKKIACRSCGKEFVLEGRAGTPREVPGVREPSRGATARRPILPERPHSRRRQAPRPLTRPRGQDG